MQVTPRKTARTRAAKLPLRLVRAEPLISVNKDVLNSRLQKAMKSCFLYQIVDAIKAGADADLRGRHGVTPLMILCRAGWHEEAARLIELGADVNARDHPEGYPEDYPGQTVLMHASRWGDGHRQRKIVRLLLEKGADRSAEWDGMTALDIARHYKCGAIAEALNQH